MDLYLLQKINTEWTHPFLGELGAIVSNIDLFRIPLAITVILLAIFGGFRSRAFLITIALCLFLGDSVIGWSIKHLTNRLRPHEAHTWVFVRELDLKRERIFLVKVPLSYQVNEYHKEASGTGRGYSMPSGHMINNLILALLVLFFVPRWAILGFLWAALIGWARIYTGSHYPSDVLVGALVGTLSVFLVTSVLNWLWPRLRFDCLESLQQKYPEFVPIPRWLKRRKAQRPEPMKETA